MLCCMIDSILESLGLVFCSFWSKALITLLTGALGIFIILKKKQETKRAQMESEWNSAGENVVILHQFERSPTCPSPSPFPIKLETYLRMTGIKYVNDFKMPKSSKGKSPWITINGQEVADSQLAIDYLNKTLGKSPSGHLDKVQRAQARSFRIMLEDHYYWPFVLSRYVHNDFHISMEFFPPIPYLSLILQFLTRTIKKQALGHGMGRHTREEVERMGMEDLRALSDFLGDKPFLMGDEPCEEDCAVFGFLCMPLYCAPKNNLYHMALEEELVNLVKYSERMQERFWPDWEEARYNK